MRIKKTPKDLTENKDVMQLPEKKEEKQIGKNAIVKEKEQSAKNAIVKGVIVCFVTAVIVGVALAFATALSVPAIIGLAAGSALIVGAGQYIMSKPKPEMKEVKEPVPRETEKALT
ncbi:MAG: hypothetical protein WBIAU2_00360 [Wolbachia endosymbiont of Drosophila biauraria]|nr:MAG: hypothetical protein WBIAU2_00360 [Wolbachia endosymbiont of Drosophila biauraria]